MLLCKSFAGKKNTKTKEKLSSRAVAGAVIPILLRKRRGAKKNKKHERMLTNK
jgi:hypothetical protein